MTHRSEQARRAALAPVQDILRRDYPHAEWRILLGVNRGRDAVVWLGLEGEVLVFETRQRVPSWNATVRRRCIRRGGGALIAKSDAPEVVSARLVKGLSDLLGDAGGTVYIDAWREAFETLCRAQADHLVRARCAHCRQPVPEGSEAGEATDMDINMPDTLYKCGQCKQYMAASGLITRCPYCGIEDYIFDTDPCMVVRLEAEDRREGVDR